jgi:endonuclease/exonuclease/phosphatase family metal-dependent hydrolase
LLWVSGILLATILLFIRWKLTIGLVLLLAAGWPIARNGIAWNPAAAWQMTKAPGSLRVMQWNCENLPGYDPTVRLADLQKRGDAVDFIRRYQPDVICIQDFDDYDSSAVLRSNLALLRDTLGYSHHAFDVYYTSRFPWGYRRSGIAIFSKIPLAATGHLPFTGRRYPESVLYADLRWQGKTIRIATTHLASMHLNRIVGVHPPPDHHFREDSLVITSGSTLRKLRRFQPYHVEQARQVRHFLDSSGVPVVLGADLNNMPSSWVYPQVRGALTDAFLQGGRGTGKSYASWVPMLRIDYLFCPPNARILQCQTFPVTFSDHFPVIADLVFP